MRIKMAVCSHTQNVLLCLVTFLCLSIFISAIETSSANSHDQSHSLRKRRLRREAVTYDQELVQTTVFPEDAADDTFLFDFKTVIIDGKSATTFTLKVITTEDSKPPTASIFQVDGESNLVFSNSISREDRRRNYFDYEQYPKIVTVIEATPVNPDEGKKFLKVTLSLSDVNDELPVLKNQPKPYLAAIPVDSRMGDTVYILLAEDPDTDADLKYSIDTEQLSIDSEITTIFKMDEVLDNSGPSEVLQGHIKIASMIDFVKGSRYKIPVIIEDRNGAPSLPRFTTAEVDVLVGPRPPQFFLEKYEGSIFETDTADNLVLSGSADELIVKVHQFQENVQSSLRLIKDNNEESTQFRIDENGKVYNTEALDFDIQDSARPPRYQLLVKVEETSDSNVLENTVPLTITVKDENDNSPRFQLTQYLKTIPEDMPPGTSILSVLAEDHDSGKNAEINYELESDYFRIEKREADGKVYGDIYVKAELDFDAEPGPIYRFIVTAKDSGSPVLSSSVDVFITTSNVNDENPVFEPQESLVLSDDVTITDTNKFPLTRMRAQDKDGDGVKFYFSNPSQGNRLTRVEIFEIVPSTGIIEVIRQVPANINKYYLNVTAMDDGMCCGGTGQMRQAKISFVVEIVDAVNQKPTFDKCLEYNLKASFKEMSEAGVPVIQVSASDTGRGVNGIVEYFIESPNPNLPGAIFQMNKDTGEITIQNPLDREPNTNYQQITVVAADKAVPPQKGWCTFRVGVEDINDNAPVFSIEYEVEIPANAAPGSVFPRVGATDKDIGNNSKISYRIAEEGDGALDVFAIYEETGIIYLKNKLKPGKMQYDLTVIAEDNGSPKQTGTVVVEMRVSDQKASKPPKFMSDESSRFYRVAENVKPKSPDAIITTQECSSFNPSNKNVQFFLVADQGVLHPRELDKFSISQRGNFVDVSVSDDLDYEKKKQHKIILRCQDFAALTMYTVITLTVEVVDKNDMIPYFAGMDTATGRFSGSVPENLKNQETHIVVDNIQGYDDDASPQFNQLSFKLKESEYSEYFEIYSLEGKMAAIRTTHSFDREEKERYYLTIIVDDIRPSDISGSSPGMPNSASAIVEVLIGDENDNPMVFKEKEYTRSVKETASIGEIIFSVVADDKDEVDKGRLRYKFTDTNIPFDIKDQTGEISVKSKLDFESKTEPTKYRLTLESRDSLNRYSASTQVVISVTDENDNVPVFVQKEYLIDEKVKEEDSSINKDNPFFLVKVEATDADVSRKETKIRYHLLGKGTEPGDQQIFKVNDTTGDIHLVATLDRDTNPEYIFTVEAIDEVVNSQKGYVNVKVIPEDINDNKPQFDRRSLVESVDEEPEERTFIAQVKATDIDFKKNAEIEYEIVSGPATSGDQSTYFFDVRENGMVYSQVPGRFLDREDHPDYFKIVVRASDKGDKPLTSTATLSIKLRDINDNPPKFVENFYNVRLSENTKEKTIIKEVVAADKDEGKNAALRYILPQEMNKNNRHFTMSYNNNRGQIVLSHTADYEVVTERHFQLTVKVMDSKDSHYDMATVNITIEDFNDNAPKFTPAYKEESIKEGSAPGQDVTTFSATDADSGINAEKSYAIDRQTDPRREFYIDPVSGLVKTLKTLDREEALTHSLRILAIDRGDPQQTGTATLEIKVEDINDNFPIFREDYQPVVDENQEDGPFPIFVIEIFAKDLDSAIFGPKFGFALPKPCDNIACENFDFRFNPDGDDQQGTAIITTSKVFDREQQEQYFLPIVMWDMRGTNSSEAMTGTNTLTITIGDVNDNEPFPGHQNVFVQNYEGLFGAFVIGRVYVKDQDDWDLPDKTFTFDGPTSLKSSFTVNNETGDITMKKGVKANFGSVPYTFRVSVYDKIFDKTVTSTVSVTVKELTEEAVRKSGSVRLAGMTASKFIQESENPTTGVAEPSLYTRFRSLMASKLGYPGVDNIEITTLRDDKDYLEVRYAAHGSPYITPAEADNAIIMNKADFENLGITVMSIPVDECQDEIFEGGCFNKLNITGKPVTINANGTSYVGVEAYLVATEGCQADIFPPSNECSGDYCYNGGVCHKDQWGTLSCKNCPSGFTGPRCQERRHSFDGDSVAFYKTFLQCEESQTSIEFVTKKKDGVIFYNGPMASFDPLMNPQDFLLLKLEDGYPVLMIDHGTGVLTLRLDGDDKNGLSVIPELSDGKWHHLDINRNGKSVELVIDRCVDAENGDHTACRKKGETPGVNMYLNVNTLLQVGGVKLFEPVSHLKDVDLPGFDGCVRNLIHNKELYNLHYRTVDGINTGKNGCQFEDAFCGIPDDPVCGVNGNCEATMDGATTCICHATYYGDTCNKRATVRDYHRTDKSYYYWLMEDQLYNDMVSNRELSAHIRFRTRQTSGNIMFLKGISQDIQGSSQDIHLKLHDGKVRLTYSLGGGRKNLDLDQAQATNGQWHTLTMEKYGTEFHLRLDGGEGRNYAYTLGTDKNDGPVFRASRKVYSGGYKHAINGTTLLDWRSTCIQDVRINNRYFAMTTDENTFSDTYANVMEYPKTKEGCVRTDCTENTCPGRTCVKLWEDHECRCNPGYYETNSQCISICNPNPCFNNVTCTVKNASVVCLCPAGWRGQLCDERNPEKVSSGDLGTGAMAAIVSAIILVILIVIIVILLYKFCRTGDEGEKYILEVDPEDDIRENVMNYDEEGAGEEDQNAYDISRLQKPQFETPYRPYDPDKRQDVHRRNAPGDKPDVGIFIDDRLKDADYDNGAPPHDSVREFTFEGGDSDAGSLSSLNTSSSDRSQDYDYLNEWGPKFAKLADMYGAGQDLES